VLVGNRDDVAVSNSANLDQFHKPSIYTYTQLDRSYSVPAAASVLYVDS
jgi:hypothetical protein